MNYVQWLEQPPSCDYNDTGRLRINRTTAFEGIKKVWQENRKRSKIKVKGQNMFNQIKDLASCYDNNITTLCYTQKRDISRAYQKGVAGELKKE